jgi:HEAT repeat protein
LATPESDSSDELGGILAGLQDRGMAPGAALICVLLDRTRERSLRVAAGERLLQSGEPGGIGPLIEQFRQETDYAEAWEYACVIGELAAPEAIAPLTDLLRHSPDYNKRVAAAYALGAMQLPGAAGALIEAVSDTAQHPAARGQAAEALANMGARQALPVLLQALHDPAVEVRFWAVSGVGALGGPEVIPELERLLSDSEELPGWWSVGEEAADMIEQIRSSEHSNRRG